MELTSPVAICFVSDPPSKKTVPLLRLLQVTPIKLIPAHGVRQADLDVESSGKFDGGVLYDLFIPAEADNCPHPSVQNRPDGHVTGDLFEEVRSGYYAYRGRSDDWIRTNLMTFCDTKYAYILLVIDSRDGAKLFVGRLKITSW